MERTNVTECGVLRAVNIKITAMVWGTDTIISQELEASNFRPAGLFEMFTHIIMFHPQL
jgi:hypothetical protein